MVRSLLILLIACLCQGCFVWDELEAGHAIMDAHSPKELVAGKAVPLDEFDAEEEAAGDGARELLASVTATVQKWWNEETAPEEPQRDPSDVPVACRVKDRTQYMRKTDCELRGGRIL